MKRITFFLLLLILSSFAFIGAEEEKQKVVVYLKEKADVKEKIGLFKTLSSEVNLNRNEFLDSIGREKVKHIFSSSNSFSAELTKKEIDELKKTQGVDFIAEDIPVQIFLQDSADLINASKSWNLKMNNLNLTGSGESICVIDTGVNFNHISLGNGWGNKVIGGLRSLDNNEDIEDCSINNSACLDDNGHGTHVAGIAAASGDINGIAKSANIVVVKALDSLGNGWGSDIVNGIEWCADNSEEYNISVISLSLGVNCTAYPSHCFSSYCDSNSNQTLYKNAINFAVGKNISVVIATGNYGNFTHISSPSCIENATRVGSSTKEDAISSFSNRWTSDMLVAPGAFINSTNISGYAILSGTSMAAPMVSGAIAILKQYFNLISKEKTPSEIKDLLYNSGKKINDTSGTQLNFSRINVYDALILADDDLPEVNLASPEDNLASFSQDIAFSCNASDLSLRNITFYLWNSSGLINETSEAISLGSSNYNFELDIFGLSSGNYEWNCLFYDEANNSAFASENSSFSVAEVLVELNSPEDNANSNINTANFNCSAQSRGELENITFYLWNSSGLIYNEPKNISGGLNSSSFSYEFSDEGEHFWNCLAADNSANSSFAPENFTFVFDNTSPELILGNLPANEEASSAQKIFYFNVSDSISSQTECSLIINDAVNDSMNATELQNNFTKTFLPGSYAWQINCTDLAGNSNLSEENSFAITSPPAQIVNLGGGGGGGMGVAAPLIYSPSQKESSLGFTRELKKQDKIKFMIFDEHAKNHTITLENITNNSAFLLIESEPVRVVLGVGQSARLNLTSADYYDLYVKLEEIINGKAKLTIQTIHDSISARVIAFKNESDEFKEQNFIKPENKSYLMPFVLLLVAFLITLIFIARVMKSRKVRSDIIKELKGKNETKTAETKGKRKR